MRAYASGDPLRLHTPGHKGRAYNKSEDHKSSIDIDLGEALPLDLTELTDDSFPSAELDAAQNRAAKFFGARHAHYLCGGSSQGVKSALYYANAQVVADINSHRSVFDGMRLCGKKCIVVGDRDSVYPVAVKQIDGALDSDTGAVIVTSPTYYGYCADVDGIKQYCKNKGLLFIADSAHGAHFGLNKHLPKSVAPVCDICNVSTHKTLRALTQSALLLDNLSDGESAKLNESTRVMGTTSPSYLLYASIERAVEIAGAKEYSSAYDALYAPIEQLKREFPFLENDDFTRLVLDCNAAGVQSEKLNAALVRAGVYSELAGKRYIVFLFTAADGPADVQRLHTALAACIRENK